MVEAIPLDTVLLGDCRDHLKTLPDDSVDSMVTDPPAGISFMSKDFDSPDTYDVEGNGASGKFIAYMKDIFKECLRVLKPGGHAVVWALPRTSHWTATALEEAGFEVRDRLTRLKDRSSELQAFFASLSTEQQELLARAEPTDSQVLQVFGTGFPKSLNIGKALDKQAGAEREVLGEGLRHGGGRDIKGAKFLQSPGEEVTPDDHKHGTLTAPATEEAKKWDGWGTALKPAMEIWWLVRKPLREKTVASQVLKTGTGGLNIDACRVKPTGERLGGGGETHGAFVKTEGWNRPWMNDPDHAAAHAAKVSSNVEHASSAGRFPSHLLLSHSPGCKRLGSKKVKAATGTNRGKGSGKNTYVYGTFNGQVDIELGASVSLGDENGEETVEAYECQETCPVRKLDEQSGERPGFNGFAPGAVRTEPHVGFKGDLPTGLISQGYGDSGGASRFFQTFDSGYECVEGCPIHALDDQSGILTSGTLDQSKISHENKVYGKRPKAKDGIYEATTGGASRFFKGFEPEDLPPFFYTPKASKADKNAGLGEEFEEKPADAYAEHRGRRMESPSRIDGKPMAVAKNSHPTTKGQPLMRYLCRLVTPPGGIVLDPFSGSGSTLVAAIAEGFQCLGMEKEPEYHAIAEARLAHALKEKAEESKAQAAFDLMHDLE